VYALLFIESFLYGDKEFLKYLFQLVSYTLGFLQPFPKKK